MLLKGRVDGIYLENKLLGELHLLALESEDMCDLVLVPSFVLEKSEDRKKGMEVEVAIPIFICLWTIQKISSMVLGVDDKGSQTLKNEMGSVRLPRELWVRESYNPARVVLGPWTTVRLKGEQATIL